MFLRTNYTSYSSCCGVPNIKKPRPGLGSGDGAKRIRTADPLHAMQVLYQLSYGPVCLSLHLRPASTQPPVFLALLPVLPAR